MFGHDSSYDFPCQAGQFLKNSWWDKNLNRLFQVLLFLVTILLFTQHNLQLKVAVTFYLMKTLFLAFLLDQ